MRSSKLRFLCTAFGLLTLVTVNLTAHSQAFGASENILWSFGNGTDGAGPFAGLIMDASGNLYGTTYSGGATGLGTVFKLAPDGKESVLWNFGNGTGAGPLSRLIMDTSGNLYGTTSSGGAYGGPNSGGTVFELTPPSTIGRKWHESILWSFGNGADGHRPQSSLIMDTGGNLYGTTFLGGTYGGNGGFGGTVFELTPPATSGGNWTESILWSFGNGADGSDLSAGLIMDTNGNLYGTTQFGGAYYGGNGVGGTLFKLTPPATLGGNWTESILWSFGNGSDGAYPLAGLIMDTSGNLYGTTRGGGAYGGNGGFSGTVFELTPPATSGGNWTESILWSFGNGTDGSDPSVGLIMDTSGNLYGTTVLGGAFNEPYGSGTVFRLTPPTISGGNWSESILWSFDQAGYDGVSPYGSLIIDASGNLYGTTLGGGGSFSGTGVRNLRRRLDPADHSDTARGRVPQHEDRNHLDGQRGGEEHRDWSADRNCEYPSSALRP